MSRSRSKTYALAWYCLDEHECPVLRLGHPDQNEWANMNRTVAHDAVGLKPVSISTVFLVFDHGLNWLRDEAGELYQPVLWETMVFGGALDGQCQRYTSAADARAGHQQMVTLVKEREGIFDVERAISFE